MEHIYIPRAMEGVIREAAQYFSVISVTGPRQSGKSTLLKHMFPDFERYSMKDVNEIDSWIKTPVVRKVVVYTGDFENTAGDIKIVNYRNLEEMLRAT